MAGEIDSMAKQVKVLEFDVKSTDPDLQTIEAVREAVKLSADLQAALGSRFPGVKVKIKRAEGLPIHELVQHILVSIDWHAVASGAEKAIAQFATSQFLNLAADRVRNMFASPAATQPQLPPADSVKKATAKGKPAKKTAAAKNATTSKKVATKKGSSSLKRAPKKSSAKSKEKGKG